MKYFLAVMAIFKNESMIIKEWVEHHLWQGVEHFYLIDNGSTDNYLEVLQPYIDRDLITLFYLPEKHKQVEHYVDVFKQIKNETEWIMIIDIDEYFYCIEKPIKELLLEFGKNYNLFVGYWYSFGSSGYEKQPEEIRTSFIKRREFINLVDHNSKSIIKASDVQQLGIHKNKQKTKNRCMIYSNPETLRVNHYQIMSKEYFEKIKMSNGDVFEENRDNIRTWNYFNYRDNMANYTDTTLSDLVKNGYKNKN